MEKGWLPCDPSFRFQDQGGTAGCGSDRKTELNGFLLVKIRSAWCGAMERSWWRCGNVHRGFEYPLIKFAVISESDVFGQEHKKKKRQKTYEGQKIQSFTELIRGRLCGA